MSRRQQKAEATRQRVLDGALELFLRDGYAATTIVAISEIADVAVQTVYAVFGSKKAILDELRARAVVGDAPGPLRDQDDWRTMEREPDPRAQLRMLAAISARIGEAMGPLYVVMAGAAASDADIAATFDQQQQARWDDQHRVARTLARRGALRAGLTANDATDVMWAIANPRTCYSLVTERGWDPARYEQMLADALVGALLEPI